MIDRKEYARNMRENAVTDDNGIVQVSPELWAQIADIVAGSSEWISVKDKLPDNWRDSSGTLVNYLVFMPEYGVDVGNYLPLAKKWLCMGIYAKVTHWMPLPAPPVGGDPA